MTLGIIGMGIVTGASLALYLASPHQLIMKRPLPAPVLGWGGLAGLVLGLVLLLQWAGPATAVFIALTLAMLVLTVVPLAAAWLRRPKRHAR